MTDFHSSTAVPHPQSDAVASLLSLSIAAAVAEPIPIHGSAAQSGTQPSSVSDGNFTDSLASSSVLSSTSVGSGVKSHRRLASTGKTRRRLSDAREAATRPSPAALQSSALSLANLSLSSSPPALIPGQISTSFTGASQSLVPDSSVPQYIGTTSGLPLNDGSNIPQTTNTGPDQEKPVANSIPVGKSAKKRGMDHKCESCSKIYRHPSCLIKHRWEHTPHWREASKFVLSKHQQVQLLEAAAILSHLSPSATGTSLPEDRSLWPSFLSGGSLPLPDGTSAEASGEADASQLPTMSSSPYLSHPTSSSVPASSLLEFNRANSSGPRLHDYSIPSAAGTGGVTQLRPGLLAMSTGSGMTVSSSSPMPVPVPNSGSDSAAFRGYRSSTSESWTSSPYGHGNAASPYQSTGASAGSIPYTHSDERSSGHGASGWSLPRSSVRSVSVSSQSRSRSGSASGSRSDDESVDVDVEGFDDYQSAGYNSRHGYTRNRMWKREEDEFSIGFSVREEDEEDAVVISKPQDPKWDDDMELEMDMD